MIRRNLYRALPVVLVMLGAAAGFAAAPTAITGPGETGAGTGAIDIELVPAKAATPRQGDQTPSGNPLWAIPLTQLSATPERPIFSPSPRPPPPAAARCRRALRSGACDVDAGRAGPSAPCARGNDRQPERGLWHFSRSGHQQDRETENGGGASGLDFASGPPPRGHAAEESGDGA